MKQVFTSRGSIWLFAGGLPSLLLLALLFFPLSACNDCTFSITTDSLPDAQIGTAYSQILESDCEDSVWSLSGNSTLPSGLTLLSEGVITGTPDRAEVAEFVIKAVGVDTSLVELKEYSITVTDPGTTGTNTRTADTTIGNCRKKIVGQSRE